MTLNKAGSSLLFTPSNHTEGHDLASYNELHEFTTKKAAKCYENVNDAVENTSTPLVLS